MASPTAKARARWDVLPADTSARDLLTEELGISNVLATLLLHRRVAKPEDAKRFLRPTLDHLLDPYTLRDMDRAVERIERAIRDGEKILLFGDYDVDGISGTALLYHWFALRGVVVDTYIPNRLTEGYSMSAPAVREIVGRGVKVVVSIDNGSGAAEEIEAFREAGVDVIVTDHHEIEAPAPRPHALVNPKREDCDYPFALLAGVGVAFKLATALSRRFTPRMREGEPFRKFLMDALALAALGTISDVVPLVGENRVLAKFGLKAIGASELPGLRELLRIAKVDTSGVEAWDVGYRIGPRLNAAGRMGDPGDALSLLLDNDPETARTTARRIDRTNSDRQAVERGILEECRARVLADDEAGERSSIVLGDDAWHRGVLGIVAAKLAGEFHRPTILLGFDDGMGKGPARSVPGFHILEAIRRSSKWLEDFGGHAFAAGVALRKENFEAFREAFDSECENLAGEEAFRPSLRVDLEVGIETLDVPLLREIEMLAPHGEGNPAPLFLARGLRVAGPPKLMGRHNRHLRMFLNRGETTFRAVGFGLGSWIETLHDSSRIDIVYQPRINRFGGRDSIELMIRDLQEA